MKEWIPMQCKCGGEVKSSSHTVKTAKGLASWHDAPFDKSVSPYDVEQSTCSSCGRNAAIIVTDVHGHELLPRWPEKYIKQPSLI